MLFNTGSAYKYLDMIAAQEKKARPEPAAPQHRRDHWAILKNIEVHRNGYLAVQRGTERFRRIAMILLPQDDPLQSAREEMVRTQLAERGIRDPRVLDAMRKVPRHEFVAGAISARTPTKIIRCRSAREQTISQPYIVAAMLEHLALRATDRVLEVGTGSGYVTALLSLLCAEVYSVERHAQLAAVGGTDYASAVGLSQCENQNWRWQLEAGRSMLRSMRFWFRLRPLRCRLLCLLNCAKADE